MYLILPHYRKRKIYKHDQESLIKGVLRIIQIKNIELEIRFEDKVIITSQLEEVMTDIEVQCWLTDTHLLTMDRVLVMKMNNELMKELFKGKNIAQWLSQQCIAKITSSKNEID
ncbi:hypothetical protein F8M41_013240 [Gigaspora margarita]|uniref:Uncharacterized protein n=1 Tax=Gigaspora margarita TaxID=4874 RepID=A0A8H3ZZF0_GIGMA|nr:hypothetical protein F8M41_013240 [Gigaspora margarita]